MLFHWPVHTNRILFHVYKHTIYVRYYEHVYKTKRGNFHSKVNGELSQENHRLHAQVKRDSADIY